MSPNLYEFQKRIIDVISALILLLVFMPVWFIVPVAIVLDSKGPIIFRHKRIGKNGVEFEMLKFRSMVNGAHELLHQKDPDLLKRFKDSDWKLANDPRITKVGKFLRTTSIDEFPQLINVLKGEMSLVGPRAYMTQEIREQVQKYPKVKKLVKSILSVKPGLTGPWQVAGRNDIPFDQRAILDAAYAKRLSILYDIQIMLRTPRAMLSKW
jgi:exopolysaccharide production protein ExoY